MNVINKVGKKNVEEAYYESLEANDFFENKKFIEAGESFLKASSLNPFEISYFENAANSFIQAGEDDKAVNILKNLINKLNPRTGKAEYLLGITLIGQKNYIEGCEYLNLSLSKGFKIPKIIFDRFCNLKK